MLVHCRVSQTLRAMGFCGGYVGGLKVAQQRARDAAGGAAGSADQLAASRASHGASAAASPSEQHACAQGRTSLYGVNGSKGKKLAFDASCDLHRLASRAQVAAALVLKETPDFGPVADAVCGHLELAARHSEFSKIIAVFDGVSSMQLRCSLRPTKAATTCRTWTAMKTVFHTIMRVPFTLF